MDVQADDGRIPRPGHHTESGPTLRKTLKPVKRYQQGIYNICFDKFYYLEQVEIPKFCG